MLQNISHRSDIEPHKRGKACGPTLARSILVVDDHPIARHGLRRVLEKQKDLTACGEANDRVAARLAVQEFQPNLVVIDFSLKLGDGAEFVNFISELHKVVAILVISMHEDTIYAERMLNAGAKGYIMKDAPCEELLISIRRVMDGDIYVSKSVANQMIERIAVGGPQAASDPFQRLSNREIQVLQKIGAGISTREVASELNLSIKTVESHRQRIKRKLNLRTATQLSQYAFSRFPDFKITARIHS